MATRCNAPRAMTAGRSIKLNPVSYYMLNTVTNESITCRNAAHAVAASCAANKKANKPNLWVACQQSKDGFIMLDMSVRYKE